MSLELLLSLVRAIYDGMPDEKGRTDWDGALAVLQAVEDFYTLEDIETVGHAIVNIVKVRGDEIQTEIDKLKMRAKGRKLLESVRSMNTGSTPEFSLD